MRKGAWLLVAVAVVLLGLMAVRTMASVEAKAEQRAAERAALLGN